MQTCAFQTRWILVFVRDKYSFLPRNYKLSLKLLTQIMSRQQKNCQWFFRFVGFALFPKNVGINGYLHPRSLWHARLAQKLLRDIVVVNLKWNVFQISPLARLDCLLKYCWNTFITETLSSHDNPPDPILQAQWHSGFASSTFCQEDTWVRWHFSQIAWNSQKHRRIYRLEIINKCFEHKVFTFTGCLFGIFPGLSKHFW